VGGVARLFEIRSARLPAARQHDCLASQAESLTSKWSIAAARNDVICRSVAPLYDTSL
jgi:hypothetical protein